MREFSDYVLPDQALANGEIDANLMQHTAYLEKFAADNDLNISKVIAVPTAGAGIFSDSIKSLKEEQLIDSLLDEDIFEEIFYEFYKEINQNYFNISKLRYDSTQSSYRLSLINKKYKNGEVGRLVQSIRNNKQFLKASFDVDYLVNGRINSPIFEYMQFKDYLKSPYLKQPSERDNLFSNNLEFIDIDKTVEKLRRERHE